MRVVITGATGNLGTSLLDRLSRDASIDEVVGIARREPPSNLRLVRTRFERADVARDDLEPLFERADVVVHLAWRLQPSHDRRSLDETNVEGSRRVFEAAGRAGVGTLLYASSIGAYSAGPKDRLVDESWPTAGIETSLYSRQKSRVERILDEIQQTWPRMRVVRFRPALIFKRDAASDIRRLFLGPFVPRLLFDRRVLVAVPEHPRLRFQCVHSMDVAEAFRLAVHRDVHGAFNLASHPVIDAGLLHRRLGAHRIGVPRGVMWAFAAFCWRARILPANEGWLDLALDSPLIDWARAHDELGWEPARAADEALLELLTGLREGAGLETPPMEPRRGMGVFRAADPA